MSDPPPSDPQPSDPPPSATQPDPQPGDPQPGDLQPDLPDQRPPVWAGVSAGTGLALVAVAALTFLGIVAQGLAVEEDTGAWYQLGIAFLRNLDASPIGLMLVLAVALVAVAVIATPAVDQRADRATTITLGLAAALAVLVAAGTVLGVVTRLHFDSAPGQQITTLTRRVLATFVVRNLGPALVAFGAAAAVMRLRSPRAVPPGPYREDGEPGPAAGPS